MESIKRQSLTLVLTLITLLTASVAASAQSGYDQSGYDQSYPAAMPVQQYQPPVDMQFGQPMQSMPVYADQIVDPLQSIEARLESMQYQIDSVSSIGNRAGCNSNCRNSCRSCDESQAGGLYFGAGVIYAKPHLKEAFQHSQINFQTGQQTLVPFEYDYDASIRGQVGFKTKNGFGVRGTYWGFNADGQTSTNTADGINVYGAHAVSVIFPANIFAVLPGETLVNEDALETKIYNVYATYDKQSGKSAMSFGVGLRHARLEQSLNSVVTSANGQPIRQLTWRREYEGLGPAVNADFRRRVGCSPFSVFAQGSGSFLFGTKSLNRTVLGDQSPNPASPFLALNGADEVVGIGAVSFGAEWAKRLSRGHTLALRGSYEGQLWAEAGAPTLGFLGFEGFGASVELRR